MQCFSSHGVVADGGDCRKLVLDAITMKAGMDPAPGTVIAIADVLGGFYRSVQIGSLQPLQLRQQLTSTFLTSLFRIEPETYKHQYKESNSAAYSKDYRKIAEEITCKADRKDSLCKISKEFSDMFLAFGQNFVHWLKYNIGSKLCQVKRVIPGFTQYT